MNQSIFSRQIMLGTKMKRITNFNDKNERITTPVKIDKRFSIPELPRSRSTPQIVQRRLEMRTPLKTPCSNLAFVKENISVENYDISNEKRQGSITKKNDKQLLDIESDVTLSSEKVDKSRRTRMPLGEIIQLTSENMTLTASRNKRDDVIKNLSETDQNSSLVSKVISPSNNTSSKKMTLQQIIQLTSSKKKINTVPVGVYALHGVKRCLHMDRKNAVSDTIECNDATLMKDNESHSLTRHGTDDMNKIKDIFNKISLLPNEDINSMGRNKSLQKSPITPVSNLEKETVLSFETYSTPNDSLEKCDDIIDQSGVNNILLQHAGHDYNNPNFSYSSPDATIGSFVDYVDTRSCGPRTPVRRSTRIKGALTPNENRSLS